MTSTVQTRIAATGGVVLLALAVFVLLVSIAQAAGPLTQLERAHAGAAVSYAAAPLSQLQRAYGGAEITYPAAGHAGRNTSIGRGTAFVTTTPLTKSTAAISGGITLTALLIALVAFLALGSRASRRGELAPVTSLVQAPSVSPASNYEDRERKAA